MQQQPERGGPQAAFGRLYQWLQFSKNERDRGPIRDVVRDYILSTFVVEPGTVLFGERVDHRRRHSAATLARQTGLHTTTLSRALRGAGLLPAEGTRAFASVDAAEAEALAERIKASIPITKISAYLNCHRGQAEMLVKHGLLHRIAPVSGPAAGVLNYVAIEAVEELLRRLRDHGLPVQQSGPGMVNMIEASELARWPTIDIVRLVLDRHLNRIELLPIELGFKSVLVNVEEITHQITGSSPNAQFVSASEAAVRLRLRRTAVGRLISHYDDARGRPFLVATRFANAKGVRKLRIAIDEVDRFADEHIKLGELAIETGMWDRKLRSELESRGVLPILPREVLDGYIYRRGDIDEATRKLWKTIGS